MVPHPAPECQTTPLIPQYYAGKEVFVTGATGFMGKVLVERLLWTCPEITRLHLLIRQKKDIVPDNRLKELKQCQLFDVIRQRCPERLKKLSVVAGDISKSMLNMNSDALQQLSKVSVVFHFASVVRFDAPLSMAVDQNVRSVLSLMDVCDQLPMVQVFIYVSTAYSNSEQSIIEERVYPTTVSAQQLLALVENLPEHIFDDITPKLISPKANTYSFTKSIAEGALAQRARACSYATAIFRPSIVVSSLQHPFPGWIENLNGPSSIAVASGKGLLHVAPISGSCIANLIPVDIAIDTLIAVAWETGIDNSRDARVYICSSENNSLSWDTFRKHVLRSLRNHPFDDCLWYPFTLYTTNTPLLRTAEWMLQIVPLHTIGFLYTMFGIKQKIKMSTVCRRVRAATETLRYYTTRDWQFRSDNVQHLRDRLSPADAALYNLHPHSIDWESHCMDFVKGLRKYLLRESDKDLDKAHFRMWMLYIIHQTTKCLIAFCMFRVAIKSTPNILHVISAVLRRLRFMTRAF